MVLLLLGVCGNGDGGSGDGGSGDGGVRDLLDVRDGFVHGESMPWWPCTRAGAAADAEHRRVEKVDASIVLMFTHTITFKAHYHI